MASRFVQIFHAASMPVAGSTEGESAEEKMAKDARSKTGSFSLLGYKYDLRNRQLQYAWV